jgi:signal transduction histidine kinase
MATRGASAKNTNQLSFRAPESSWYLVLAFGAVVLVVVLHALRDIYDGAPWSHTLLPSAAIGLQTVALTYGYRWLNHRNVRRGFIAAAGVVISSLFGVAAFLLHADPTMSMLRIVGHGIPFGLLIGLFWVLVFLLPSVVRSTNLRIIAAESIRREAELAQLRSSLQPHFLLNTLHTISALTVDEPLVARRLLTALGDLLRDALESAPELRPLETDIAWLRRYAEILEVRHGDSLHFEWEIEPETTAVLLPKLLLQPLIENAVKHGALHRADGGVVTVRARFTNQALQLVVEDNGPGIALESKDGLGLRIVRERIGLAHPVTCLNIQSSPEGTRATIEIPCSQKGRL